MLCAAAAFFAIKLKLTKNFRSIPVTRSALARGLLEKRG